MRDTGRVAGRAFRRASKTPLLGRVFSGLHGGYGPYGGPHIGPVFFGPPVAGGVATIELPAGTPSVPPRGRRRLTCGLCATVWACLDLGRPRGRWCPQGELCATRGRSLGRPVPRLRDGWRTAQRRGWASPPQFFQVVGMVRSSLFPACRISITLVTISMAQTTPLSHARHGSILGPALVVTPCRGGAGGRLVLVTCLPALVMWHVTPKSGPGGPR